MKTIEETIEIDAPVSTAYNQWTQFETFPQFMKGVGAESSRRTTSTFVGPPKSVGRRGNGMPK